MLSSVYGPVTLRLIITTATATNTTHLLSILLQRERGDKSIHHHHLTLRATTA
jgi:hypothetical protein